MNNQDNLVDIDYIIQQYPTEQLEKLSLEDQGMYVDYCIAFFDRKRKRGERGPWPLVIQWLRDKKRDIQKKIILRDSKYPTMISP